MSVHVEACIEPRLGQVTLTPRIALSPSARADGILAVFTLGRLALVPVLALSFPASPLVTTIALLLFIVADIYDGELARRYHADGPRRRALDSTVDRIGIDAFLVAAWAAGALPTALLIPFLVRDGYCALICALMMRQRNVAIKADWLYRTLNLSVAAWAISAPFADDTLRTALAIVLLAASLVVAVDLTRSVRRVLAAAADVVDGVIDAGGLRRGVVRWYAKAPETARLGRACSMTCTAQDSSPKVTAARPAVGAVRAIGSAGSGTCCGRDGRSRSSDGSSWASSGSRTS